MWPSVHEDERYVLNTYIKTDAKKMRQAFLSIALVIRDRFLQFKVFLKAG